MTNPVEILALLTGKVAPLGDSGIQSAIRKRPIETWGRITETGLQGDEQGDRRNHGGPEKALHHYPFDHYAQWRAELPNAHSILEAPGAFGENISTLGMTEANVCVGDIYRLGDALVQVSQGRQPCFKLNARFEHRQMARNVQSAGRTGWYYRVLRTGRARAGDVFALEERPHPDWSLARLLHAMFIDTLNMDALREIVALEALSPSWKATAQRRIEKNSVENWSMRLGEQSGA